MASVHRAFGNGAAQFAQANRLLVQIQQAGIAPSTVLGSVIGTDLLVTLGASLGFILGIQLSHWLHPTVAITY
ncbi:hypothetical protein O9993_16935 [Vibrio lentus]|nr:hypothetical protein [Vibrio lentus]